MRAWFGLAFLVAAATTGPALGQSPSTDFERDFLICASTTIDPRERIAACDTLLESEALDGGSITALVHASRGVANMTLRRFEEAARDLTRALEIEPSNIGFLQARANVFSQMGETALAIADIDLAIEIAPEEDALFVSRAIAFAESKNLPAAYRDLDKAERLNAGNSTIYEIRAELLMTEEAFDDAEEQFSMAIALRPEEARLYFRRGVAIVSRGEEALEDFETAVALGEDTPEVYLYRAFARNMAEDRDGAFEDFSAVIDRDPSLPLAWFRRGLINMDRHAYADAYRDFDVATQIDPNADYLNAMAWLLVSAEDLEFRDPVAALDYVTRSIELDENADNIDTAAAAHALLDNQDEAMGFYIRSMELGGEERVRMYQEYLAERGYYTGTIDGADGPLTRAAIKAFAEQRKVLLVD